ncbi:hypothetical protein DL768_000029 [Monosporascus sp. mg162]|nr:hypothetical protein DL768_000029 [Monosporascus sp. mg162]
MAQGRKATRRGIWDEDTETELLAFLDYCITRSVKFDAAVTGHTKRTTGKDLGLQRSIKLTMYRLRKAYGMGHVEHANLLKQGTSCLPGVSPERRMKIEQAKSNEHAELQEKYEDLQRRYKELERSSQSGNGAQGMQGDGNHVFDDEYGHLRRQDEELDRRYKDLKEASHSESAALEKTIEDLRRLRSHATQVGAHCFGLDFGHIWQRFALLDDQIGKASLTLKDSPAALDPAGAGSDWKTEFQRLMERIMGTRELNALENSIGGRGISEPEILRKFAEVRQLGTQEVLRSLASAYVCSVVFEDGPYALRSMDVLGHEAWTSEQKFATEVLYKKSKEMASGLATLLAPVLQPNMLNEETSQLEMSP